MRLFYWAFFLTFTVKFIVRWICSFLLLIAAYLDTILCIFFIFFVGYSFFSRFLNYLVLCVCVINVYSVVLNRLLNYAVPFLCVIYIYILYVMRVIYKCSLYWVFSADGYLSELIDTLDDDVNMHLTNFPSGACFRSVGVASTVTSSSWLSFTGLFFVICWFIHSFVRHLTFCRYFVGYSFGTLELSVIVTKMRRYVKSNGGFWYGSIRRYVGHTGRVSLPDLLANSHLNTAICHRWSQPVIFECREVQKRKDCDHTTCPFCVRVVFIVKVCRLTRLGHVVTLSSILGHVKFEDDLSIEEKRQFVTVGKMSYTGL